MSEPAIFAQLRGLLGVAAKAGEVDRVLLVSASRAAPVARARFAFCWAASHGLGASSRVIGQVLGSRAHPTILAALRRAEQLRASDPAFRSLTEQLLATTGQPDA